MLKIVHLVPYDGVGGVEVAARSLENARYPNFQFSKYYLVNKNFLSRSDEYTGHFRSENNPSAYLEAILRMFRLKPEVLIASLWRSCIVAIATKLLRPKTCVVTFLHLPKDVHWLDKVFNRTAMFISNEIWADSQTTLDARVPEALKSKARVISFLLENDVKPVFFSPKPQFVFWGRLHEQKNIVRALRIFAGIRTAIPDATFYLIGPDGGAQVKLEIEIKLLGLEGSVFFMGTMDRVDIFKFARSCSFYLQTSVNEGMAMSVIEAMQIGLVPVVTPVGEIRRYCIDSQNAIVISDDLNAVDRIVKLIGDSASFQKLSKAAFYTWQNQPCYRDDVIAACTRIVRQIA